MEDRETDGAAADAGRLLIDQLAIAWSLATEVVFPALTDDLAHWHPSGNSWDLGREAGEWRAELPDETIEPLPDPTPAWILWHVLWWWTVAAHWARGEDTSLDPAEVRYPGSIAEAVRGLELCHDEWVRLLESTDSLAPTRAPFPMGRTFGGLAGWVNFELTKNIAELNQLARWYRNRDTGAGPV